MAGSADAAIAPEIQSFFRAIKENPDDDTPRLIFADWLQERGDAAEAARGEYLRLSVLRHRLSPDDPQYDLLKRREGELFTQHRWSWLGPLVDAARKWTFERGMIQIEAQAEKLTTPEVRAWAGTAAGLWIDALRLTEVIQERVRRHHDPAYEHIVHLTYSPVLAYLNRLDLSENSHQIAFLFRTILDPDKFPFLTELLLTHNWLTTRELLFLTRYRHFRRLTRLDLGHNRLEDADARLLAESSHLRNVAALHLRRNRFTEEGIALLREAFGERLHL